MALCEMHFPGTISPPGWELPKGKDLVIVIFHTGEFKDSYNASKHSFDAANTD